MLLLVVFSRLNPPIWVFQTKNEAKSPCNKTYNPDKIGIKKNCNFSPAMFKAMINKLKGNGFVRECMLFKCDTPYYWFLGIMVWSSLVMFLYAGFALIRLGI